MLIFLQGLFQLYNDQLAHAYKNKRAVIDLRLLQQNSYWLTIGQANVHANAIETLILYTRRKIENYSAFYLLLTCSCKNFKRYHVLLICSEDFNRPVAYSSFSMFCDVMIKY